MIFNRRFNIRCCDKNYSVSDPFSYKLLTVYSHSPTKEFIKTKINGEVVNIKVCAEYTLILQGCIKCEGITARVFRIDKDSNIIRRGSESHSMQLSGKNLQEHFDRISKMEDLKLIKFKKPEIPEEKTLHYLPLRYYEATSPESTGAHYLGGNNSRTSDKTIKCKIKEGVEND